MVRTLKRGPSPVFCFILLHHTPLKYLNNMAKSPYFKKRSGGNGAGRYTKKKAVGRVAKRSGTKTSIPRALIAGEVQKVLNSGAHNERRKVTLALSSNERQIFINGKHSLCNCIRISITDAIPSQQGAAHAPDARKRRANKIVVTGVSIRASFSVSDETRVMVLLYEPHESVRKVLNAVPLETVPNAKAGHVPENWRTVKVPYEALGLVSKHEPLMTKKSGEGIALDSVDGTVFESRLSTHAGKPIGTVVHKKLGGEGLRRTQNWNQGGVAQVGMGYTSWTTHTVNEYWKLNREYTYMYEGMNDQVFERSAEMILYVDCPSLDSKEISEE